MAGFEPRTMKRKNIKGLGLSTPAPQKTPSAPDSQIPGALGNSQDRNDTLEIGLEFKLDLRAEDLIVLKEIGAGNGGTVAKVQHVATKAIMARKIIHVEAKKEVRKRIVQELAIMHECNSPYIVSFYGAFTNNTGDVVMCMEFMDCGSLDSISKNFGPVRVDVLGKISEAILGGLTYLYSAHKIMHRDIKPSNVLVNSRGYIKLCDFGVSSELENSVADTFVGTGTFMAPERIQGSPYTVKSDVWSVGLTVMQLAIGKFPFATDSEGNEEEPAGLLDLLHTIVLEPSPKLPKSDAFPHILDQFIEKCLLKDPSKRPTPQELYETDPFLQAAKRTPVDLEAWAVSMSERSNQRSHISSGPRTDATISGPLEGPASSQPSPMIDDIPIENLSINPSTNQHAGRPYPERTSSSSRVAYAQQSQMQASNYASRPAYPSGPPAHAPSRSNGFSPQDINGRDPRYSTGAYQTYNNYGYPSSGGQQYY